MTLPPLPTQLTGNERVNGLRNVTKVRDIANLANMAPIKQYAGSGTLEAEDFGYILHVDSANPVTITVPADEFPAQAMLTLMVLGAGSLTFAEGAGVTIDVPTGKTLVANEPQYKFYQLYQYAEDTWVLVGDLA